MFEVKTNNGVTYGTSDAGFTLNGGTAQYVNLSNNANLTLNERIAVNPESGWTFNRGLQAPNYSNNNSQINNESKINDETKLTPDKTYMKIKKIKKSR